MQGFLLEHYAWLKAAHIVVVIFWMAGMLYLPRLFVYHCQATPGGELDVTLKTQERLLLRAIMNPSLVAVWLFAGLMLFANPALFAEGWMHVKLTAVVLMSGAHGYYAAARKRFEAGTNARSQRFWRIVNEVPALLAVLVVFMAVLKPGF